jgi:hypothetical protein
MDYFMAPTWVRVFDEAHFNLSGRWFDSSFYANGHVGNYWISNSVSSYLARDFLLSYYGDSGNINTYDNSFKGYGFAIRCVRPL